MATYTALHIKNANVDALSAHLTAWLEVTHESAVVASEGPFPNDFYASTRFINSEDPPSEFLLAAEPPGWVTAYFNSFAELQGLASDISGALKNIVIVVLAQSVSEAYFVSVHENGARLRAIYWAGDTGEWITREGTPFPFEQLYSRFEREELISFCQALDLSLWSTSNNLSWHSLRARSRPVHQSVVASFRKPWWRFWRSGPGA